MFKRILLEPLPTRATSLLALLFAASLGCSSAFAQRGHDQGQGHGYGHGYGYGQRGGGPHGHGDGAHLRGRYHGGNYRGGHWEHGRIGGRTVWWWAAGPVWYYYPTPLYPYPYAYLWVPPSVAGPALGSPSAPYWYYCDADAGYYPYVTQCPGGFRAVAPSDPNAPAPGVPR